MKLKTANVVVFFQFLRCGKFCVCSVPGVLPLWVAWLQKLLVVPMLRFGLNAEKLAYTLQLYDH